MNAADAQASYRRMMVAGEVITVRRYTGSGPNRPRFDIEVRGRAVGYQPHELVAGSGIQQGDRKVLLLVEDLIAAQVPLPLQLSDGIVIQGVECRILGLDDSTRRICGELMAYELHIRG